MSKKNKRKHYSEMKPNHVGTPVVAAQSAVAATPVSKDASVYSAHREEYKHISSDLIRVLIVNGIFLIGVLILYYINKTNPFLDSWYNWIF
jgi:anaerobic C4-dicarboxylate transporter